MHQSTFSRRVFIRSSMQLSAAYAAWQAGLTSCQNKSAGTTIGKPMSILILGGTSFLGPHQIKYALERGHQVWMFNRGKSTPPIYRDMFKQVTALYGDRENDLKALGEGTWDAVIDNSGQKVSWTAKTAELLKTRVKRYVYTSSTGVYYPYLQPGIQETAKLLTVEPEGLTDEAIKLEYWYGVMKANSERAAREHFGDERTLVIRPTYMIGPGDHSGRFIHWPVRLSRGGEILVPGQAADPVQYVDVRDVAEWMIRLIEEQVSGTFNAVGPAESFTMDAFITLAAPVFKVEKSFTRIDDYVFLKSNQVTELVPWIIPIENNLASARIDNRQGLAAGLTFRPLETSVQDTFDWWNSAEVSADQRRRFEENPAAVLAREKELLQAWKVKTGTSSGH